MNKILFTGYLVADCVPKTTESGKTYVRTRVGVAREFKNTAGTYESDFIPIVAWERTADYLSLFEKGSYIEIVGRLSVTSKKDENDNWINNFEVIVEYAKAQHKTPKDTGENLKEKHTADNPTPKQEDFVPSDDVIDDDDLPF